MEYYLGLDIGTDSVGYAVTDTDCSLCKYKGKLMWGVTTFEAASDCSQRRELRRARRRECRKRQRLKLLSELFEKEIAGVDPRFFLRLNESGLHREDVSDRNVLFNDASFNDADFYRKYPTVHHLICELMQSTDPHDVRLVYLACRALIAKRGHCRVNADTAEQSISAEKVKIYNTHAYDLKNLKAFVRKYLPEKYNEVFRTAAGNLNNYVAYSYNLKSVKGKAQDVKKASREEFCKYIKKLVINVTPQKKDTRFYNGLLERLENNSFMPKQVNADNRETACQRYRSELKTILDNASAYLSFLSEADADGISVYDKIMSLFDFRIPYWVGPLNTASDKAWAVRKREKIFPWNFKDIVDADATEKLFTQRLINNCRVLPDEKVMPRHSLLYSKYCVLNEINNIKIDGADISVELKQHIFNGLFMKREKVSVEMIKDFCISHGYMTESSVIGGIDIMVNSSLRSYHCFKDFIDSGRLTEDDAERIIEHIAYAQDEERLSVWLADNFSVLSEAERGAVLAGNYKGFGKFSRKLLESVTEQLWNSNDDLMQILCKNGSKAVSGTKASNTVNRPVTRALDITEDIVKAKRSPPSKIFIETVRGGYINNGERTTSRKEKILELYESVGKEADELRKQLENMGEDADNGLRNEKMYLYFLQLGRCMYSGRRIDMKLPGCDIDHIYPVCEVNDDSLSNNKVLVLSALNSQKGDRYPVSSEIQNKMTEFWKFLAEKKLISSEKFYRLTRKQDFSDKEKRRFLNCQISDVGAIAKTAALQLKEKYPESEVIYVKAGDISDFRRRYSMVKSRAVNDLHHAKDAYLSIVVGNAHLRKYTAVECVRKTLSKNRAYLTRYPFCRLGQLFDRLPVGAAPGLIPRKTGLPTEKYGGYRKPTASFFLLAEFECANVKDMMIMPVELMHAKRYLNDDEFAVQYTLESISDIIKKPVNAVRFPLGKRIIRVNTVFEFDGMRMFLKGKCAGGRQLIMCNLMPFICDSETERYIYSLEACVKNGNFDNITADKNIELYELYIKKLCEWPYAKRPANPVKTLVKGTELFYKLSLEGQMKCLLNIQMLFGRLTHGCDLRSIGGAANVGATVISSRVSNWKKTYDNAFIVDMSASGLYESKTKIY